MYPRLFLLLMDLQNASDFEDVRTSADKYVNFLFSGTQGGRLILEHSISDGQCWMKSTVGLTMYLGQHLAGSSAILETL